MFEPLELWSEAHKLQKCTLQGLACKDCTYDAKKDSGIGKKFQIYQNDLTTHKEVLSLWKCAHEYISSKCAHYMFQCAQTLAMKSCKIEEQERKFKFSRIITQLFKRMFVPLEVCAEAHKLQKCTLQDLACTDCNYETMNDCGIGKKFQIYQNDLTTIQKKF